MTPQQNNPIFVTLAIVLALVSVLTPFASAVVTDTVTFRVTILKYEPTPVQPGEVAEAWIQVTNTGRVASKPVTILIDDSYPFTPISEADKRIALGPIAAASSYVTRVKLAVDSAAVDGMYSFPVRTTTDGSTVLTTDVSLEVRAGSSTISVLSAQTEPEYVVPGAPASLLVTVRNARASTLRDLTLALDLTNTDLATVGTTNRQILSTLDGGETATFRFELIANPEKQSGITTVPLTFTFANTEGKTITQSEKAGIIVHALPAVSVIVDRVTPLANSKDVTALVRVVNKGLSQIKFAEVTLENGDGYALSTGRRVAYVGNIDSDDFQTAEFVLTPRAAQGTLRGTLTYSDALNMPRTLAVEAPVTFPISGRGGAKPLVWVVLVVLVIGGVIFWRRRAKPAATGGSKR
jgi:hypothetical protein